MARPIKETPVLYGKSAEKFAKSIEGGVKISDEKKAEIKASYNKLMAIAQF